MLAFVPLLVRGALRDAARGFRLVACLATLLALTFCLCVLAVLNHWFICDLLMPADHALFVLIAAAIVWIAQKLP